MSDRSYNLEGLVIVGSDPFFTDDYKVKRFTKVPIGDNDREMLQEQYGMDVEGHTDFLINEIESDDYGTQVIVNLVDKDNMSAFETPVFEIEVSDGTEYQGCIDEAKADRLMA